MRRLLPLLLAALCGCSFVKQMAASGFQKPTLSFKDASLSDVTFGGATVNLVFDVQNPNDAALSLAETDYTLFVEGKQVVAGKPPDGIRIPARGTGQVTLPAVVRFADLGGSVEQVWQKREAAYRAEGHIGVDTPIGIATLPFSKEGTLPLPRLPDVQLGSPKIAQLSLSSARLEVPLTLVNQNPFPLPLASVTGNLRIAGADVGQVAAQGVGVLDGKGQKTVVLPVTVRFAQALEAARAVREGRAHVAIDGQLSSGDAAVPFHVEHDVQFAGAP
jgi:LEA14-like dessication related protein